MGCAGPDAAVQPAASQESPSRPRVTDASPQLRAPPGRARGVLLPRSASHTPEADAPMWDPVVWEKSDADWQRARTLQEQHMRRAAAHREMDRAAAEAREAVAEKQRAAARSQRPPSVQVCFSCRQLLMQVAMRKHPCHSARVCMCLADVGAWRAGGVLPWAGRAVGGCPPCRRRSASHLPYDYRYVSQVVFWHPGVLVRCAGLSLCAPSRSHH